MNPSGILSCSRIRLGILGWWPLGGGGLWGAPCSHSCFLWCGWDWSHIWLQDEHTIQSWPMRAPWSLSQRPVTTARPSQVKPWTRAGADQKEAGTSHRGCGAEEGKPGAHLVASWEQGQHTGEQAGCCKETRHSRRVFKPWIHSCLKLALPLEVPFWFTLDGAGFLTPNVSD